MTRFTYFCYHHFWNALDWVFPPACSGCGKLSIRWCFECDSKLQNLPETICEICGYPIEGGIICSRCKNEQPNYSCMRSLYSYRDEIRNALHHLKYDSDLGVGEILAEKCASFLTSLDWKIDVILPVPLGKTRKKERGYNQAALIALPMALKLGLRYGGKNLVRVKETVSQVEYSAEQRKSNVHEAFKARGNDLNGKNVLVIDDIITTGSTIDECAIALKGAGVKNVYGLSVARTMMKV